MFKNLKQFKNTTLKQGLSVLNRYYHSAQREQYSKVLGTSSHDGLVTGCMAGKHLPDHSNTSMPLSPQNQLSMETSLVKHFDLCQNSLHILPMHTLSMSRFNAVYSRSLGPHFSFLMLNLPSSYTVPVFRQTFLYLYLSQQPRAEESQSHLVMQPQARKLQQGAV